MIPTLIDRRWLVTMPEHRAIRPGWDWWERERLNYMHAVIRESDVVWEIGAEQADVSVLYAMWGAEVVLVEPDEGFWPTIKTMFEVNGVADKVLGTYHGYVGPESLVAPVTSETWPECAEGELSGDRYPLHFTDTDERQRTTLDALLDCFPAPNVVSVDIDGAEYRMLLGSNLLLAEVRPIFFISVHPWHIQELYGDTADDVLHHMELHGYQGECLANDHEVHWIFKPVP